MTHWTILENEWKEDGHRPVSWQRGLDIKHSAENSGLWTSHEKLLESDMLRYYYYCIVYGQQARLIGNGLRRGGDGI
jgi:hypothetical protein